MKEGGRGEEKEYGEMDGEEEGGRRRADEGREFGENCGAREGSDQRKLLAGLEVNR